MKLSKILNKLSINYSELEDIEIYDVSRNSKAIEPGFIFVSFDNNDIHIKEAIDNGSKVILYEGDIKKNKNVIYIKVINALKAYAIIVDMLYHKYYKGIKFIGCTGTNGKTTTTTLIYEFFKSVGLKAMLIGTNGVYYNNSKFNSINTTPDLKVIAKLIKTAKLSGIKYIIMEVSSIGYMELRVYNIPFDYIIFTNLSHDHLDYHKNMDNYLNAKLLFMASNNALNIINSEDLNFKYIDNHTLNNVYYGKNSYYPENIKYLDSGIEFYLDNYLFFTKLLGEFNLYNVLAFIRLAKLLGFDNNCIGVFLKEFEFVDGRMMRFYKDGKTLVVDYAHSPDAIKRVLTFFKTMNYNNIYTVIGCGGKRDKLKREEIGEILNKYSDYIILTNDNPRDERPMDIITDIGRGIHKNYKIILDRYKAIEEAYMSSKKNDLILILGKGNENYIIINDKKEEYSDIEAVKNIIGEH